MAPMPDIVINVRVNLETGEAAVEPAAAAAPADEVSVDSAVTNDQRRALFVAFKDVFDSTDRHKRRVFTSWSLGRTERLSWSAEDGISQQDAAKMLDNLSLLKYLLPEW